MSIDHTHSRSIPDLLASLVRQLTGLIRNEGQLARAELSEKIDKLVGAAIMIGAGAVLLLPALVILLQAAVAVLVEADWSPAAASLLVSVVVLAIGAVLIFIGLKRLQTVSFVPRKTIRQIQQDVAVATEGRHEHDVERAA
jgi:uncharacterized membrane protein YqjE